MRARTVASAQAYANFAKKDIPAILATCTDDIVFNMAGDLKEDDMKAVPYGKRASGQEEVKEFFGKIGASWEDGVDVFEPYGFKEREDGSVISFVKVRARVINGGVVSNDAEPHIWTFNEDGTKIKSWGMRNRGAQAQIDAFKSEESMRMTVWRYLFDLWNQGKIEDILTKIMAKDATFSCQAGADEKCAFVGNWGPESKRGTVADFFKSLGPAIGALGMQGDKLDEQSIKYADGKITYVSNFIAKNAFGFNNGEASFGQDEKKRTVITNMVVTGLENDMNSFFVGDSDKIKLVKLTYQQFSTQNIAGILANNTEDATYNGKGDYKGDSSSVAYMKTYKGAEERKQFFTDIGSSWGDGVDAFRPYNFQENEDGSVTSKVFVRVRVANGGVVIDNGQEHIWTFSEDGKKIASWGIKGADFAVPTLAASGTDEQKMKTTLAYVFEKWANQEGKFIGEKMYTKDFTVSFGDEKDAAIVPAVGKYGAGTKRGPAVLMKNLGQMFADLKISKFEPGFMEAKVDGMTLTYASKMESDTFGMSVTTTETCTFAYDKEDGNKLKIKSWTSSGDNGQLAAAYKQM